VLSGTGCGRRHEHAQVEINKWIPFILHSFHRFNNKTETANITFYMFILIILALYVLLISKWATFYLINFPQIREGLK